MADPKTVTNLMTILGIATFALMVWFITRTAKANRAEMLAEAEPNIAGQDELEGGARHPEQFDEPDDEALEMMSDLLGEEEEQSED